MIFDEIPFYKNVKVDTDRLGNPIYKEELIGSFYAAMTQWTKEEIAILDRRVTQNMRKLVTHAPRSVLNEFSHVYIEYAKYERGTLVSDFKRWRLVYVREVK